MPGASLGGACLAADGLAHGRLAAWPASFYDVKCAQGFQCVSKVENFGLNHNGVYEPPKALDIAPRFKEAYELGCPARGAVSGGGECRDNGEGGASKCYSTRRFEAGPQMPCDLEDKCLCVRMSVANGSPGNRKNLDIQDGLATAEAQYVVQPPVKCDECAQHSCDQKECEACESCEYTTKVLDGRKTLGCFDRTGNPREAKE